MGMKRTVIWTSLAWATLFSGMALSPSMATPPYEALNLSVYPSHTEPPPLSSHTVSGEPVSLAKQTAGKTVGLQPLLLRAAQRNRPFMEGPARREGA